MEVEEGRVRGIVLVPATFLTKICMVSSSEACELMLEMLLVRRIMVWSVVCGAVWKRAGGGSDDGVGCGWVWRWAGVDVDVALR